MKKVLIVEDERLMQDLVKEYFLAAGYEVHTADDGVMAMEVFRAHAFDLVILDIMMPKLDGFSVCRKIRKESDALIILLTAREEEEDKLLGFELGADDYVTKPFSPKVLLARAEVLMKRFDRFEKVEPVQEAMTVGGLSIDKKAYRVSVNGETLSLTKKEFDLLVLLSDNHPNVLSREQILSAVWGMDYFGDGRVLDTNIKTLRKKLGDYGKMIRTVINVGYKFEE